MANDAATPNLQGETMVFVNVRRNENRPIFTQTAYVGNIDADFPQGVSIVQVSAKDSDEQVFMVVILPTLCYFLSCSLEETPLSVGKFYFLKIFQDEIFFTLTGNEKAIEFFYVDPTTGVVSLKKSIKDDDTARYEVSIYVIPKNCQDRSC